MDLWQYTPLGGCQFVEIKSLLPMDTYVVNMIAQSGVRGPDNPTPIRYEALIECMARVREFIFKKEGSGAPTSSIHCPKFGSGLAGGNWPFIKALIEEMWSGNCIPVTVYELQK